MPQRQHDTEKEQRQQEKNSKFTKTAQKKDDTRNVKTKCWYVSGFFNQSHCSSVPFHVSFIRFCLLKEKGKLSSGVSAASRNSSPEPCHDDKMSKELTSKSHREGASGS